MAYSPLDVLDRVTGRALIPGAVQLLCDGAELNDEVVGKVGWIDLPALLSANSFTIRSTTPHIFCVRPTSYMWQWPATFIEVYLPRLTEMGRIDQSFADKLRADLAEAEKNPNAVMITPLVIEIVAEKV